MKRKVVEFSISIDETEVFPGQDPAVPLAILRRRLGLLIANMVERVWVECQLPRPDVPLHPTIKGFVGGAATTLDEAQQILVEADEAERLVEKMSPVEREAYERGWYYAKTEAGRHRARALRRSGAFRRYKADLEFRLAEAEKLAGVESLDQGAT